MHARHLIAWLTAAAVVRFTATCASQNDAGVPSTAYAHPQRLVSVDGSRRLNLFCLGHGSPVVILDAGTGGSTASWQDVQGRIAQTTTVCSYDRAGYGFSDAASRPSDAANAVDDLHRLIERAKLPVPVVLVGHSNGGIYASLYARTYPSEVAGVVLVDPGYAGQQHFERYGLPPGKAAELTAANGRYIADARVCLDKAKSGELLERESTGSSCLDNANKADAVLHAALNSEKAQPKYYEANLSEFENTFGSVTGENVNDHEAYFEANEFGSMPVIVLTAARHPAPVSDFSSEEQARYYAAWKRAHDVIASLSTDGKNIVVPNSGHFIQRDQPATLVRYVNEVVAKVRIDR
ncbi:alpha/beta fold hydrolase [Dyella acidisoli]|uniref:alpha/beta fold hydrolase n=1 Tax=Dyella acidisoli TaxID=1867834 RepID=UPI0024E0E182|nr:alpha/beta hydrolase [Dyella acidisoli]